VIGCNVHGRFLFVYWCVILDGLSAFAARILAQRASDI
jgi:hypothetical protein